MSMASIINERNRKSRLKHTIKSLIASTMKVRKNINPYKKVELLAVTPVQRTNQILVRGQARGTAEQRLYELLIMFSGASFSETKDKDHPLKISLGSGAYIYMAKLSGSNTKVQVRCTCKDYYFMWQWWNKQESALFGGKFPTYKRKTDNYPERNPDHVPGVCKHVIGLSEKLAQQGVLTR